VRARWKERVVRWVGVKSGEKGWHAYVYVYAYPSLPRPSTPSPPPTPVPCPPTAIHICIPMHIPAYPHTRHVKDASPASLRSIAVAASTAARMAADTDADGSAYLTGGEPSAPPPPPPSPSSNSVSPSSSSCFLFFFCFFFFLMPPPPPPPPPPARYFLAAFALSACIKQQVNAVVNALHRGSKSWCNIYTIRTCRCFHPFLCQRPACGCSKSHTMSTHCAFIFLCVSLDANACMHVCVCVCVCSSGNTSSTLPLPLLLLRHRSRCQHDCHCRRRHSSPTTAATVTFTAATTTATFAATTSAATAAATAAVVDEARIVVCSRPGTLATAMPAAPSSSCTKLTRGGAVAVAVAPLK